jgi:homoserine kinase type II
MTDRLLYIHAVLEHAARAGVRTVPVPIRNRLGNSYVSAEGYLWELTPWMPGVADYRQTPGRVRIEAAMRALAEFHLATADFPVGFSGSTVAPAITERRTLLRGLVEGGYQQIAMASEKSQDSCAGDLPLTCFAQMSPDPLSKILRLFPQVADQVSLQLRTAAHLSVPIQPVIRDVWHDHLLYTGNAVTGLIDFGAMRNDSVAVDVSRLLGSLASDDRYQWQYGLDAYQQIRSLSGDEYELIGTLDSSTILLSGMNWLRWIYLEGRLFEDMSRVAGRMCEIAGRLENLALRRGKSIIQDPETSGFSSKNVTRRSSSDSSRL